VTVEHLNLGWSGSIESFMQTSEQSWLSSLQRHHQRCMLMPADPSQIVAWQNCFAELKTSLFTLVTKEPNTRGWHLIFEYELPRERGRRPDVVVLTPSEVIVLEFKDTREALRAHIDQVSAYARDLQHYHSESHNLEVRPVLVLTQSRGIPSYVDDVVITAPAYLAETIGAFQIPKPDGLNPDAWIQGDYAPLPSLVAAARTIFENEPLPHIKRAHSAGINETIASLIEISERAERNNELHVALVTGVPGAGKTLVGLQFVYAHHANNSLDNRPAVFLSGNGPLVTVLQHALKSGIFVQAVHGFLKQYGGSQGRLPEEHIWVYDEAQRAWDADRVQEKRGHRSSEPEDFLRLGERMDSWAVVVGLIGEGQEIHLGEEAGLVQWNEAIASLPGNWIVHCPERVAGVFSAAEVHMNETLDLTVSLRSHLAEDVQSWIRYLLSGELETARTTANSIREQGFDTYITRDLDVASNYVRERYRGQEDKRYGLLASSKAKNVSSWGVNNSWAYTKNTRIGPWYNDPPDSRFSSCQLHDVVTEFSCQGLELDFPIIAWGDDLRWKDHRWQSPPQLRSKAHDPHQLRVNSYRVLLSRGRDGFVVFIPPDPLEDATASALIRAGLTLLES
jgi:DUF2075 family protein